MRQCERRLLIPPPESTMKVSLMGVRRTWRRTVRGRRVWSFTVMGLRSWRVSPNASEREYAREGLGVDECTVKGRTSCNALRPHVMREIKQAWRSFESSWSMSVRVRRRGFRQSTSSRRPVTRMLPRSRPRPMPRLLRWKKSRGRARMDDMTVAHKQEAPHRRF